MKKFLNTIKISCSVIGGVIGAGFITGREIMTFFFGYNRYIASLFLFVAFFILIYLILRVESKLLSFLIKKSELLILVLNVLIMASMLGATDSLAEDLFSLKSEIPLVSIILLILSTFCCLGGYDKLSKVNVVIVPIILLLFLGIVLTVLDDGQAVIQGNGVEVSTCFSYVALNIFLIQPFLIKIKEEKEVYSPIGVALFSSIILAFAIFLFLGALSEDCIYCDIPLILLVKGSRYLYFLVATIVFIAIFTTLTAVQFPFCGIFKKADSLILILVSVIAFAISRIGFYSIVDKIYPKISIIAMIYYSAFIAIYLFSVLKSQRLHTLNPREDKGLQY